MAPTMVTARPSRIQTVPRPMMTIQCHLDHGRRSIRAGMSVSMTRSLGASALDPAMLPSIVGPKSFAGRIPVAGVLARRPLSAVPLVQNAANAAPGGRLQRRRRRYFPCRMQRDSAPGDAAAAFVYLLWCGPDRSLYCGWTTDVERRLDAHRRG